MANIDLIYNYTSDGIRLQGTHFISSSKDICVLFIHGMSQSIVDNYFAYIWGKTLSEANIGLSTHTIGGMALRVILLPILIPIKELAQCMKYLKIVSMI